MAISSTLAAPAPRQAPAGRRSARRAPFRYRPVLLAAFGLLLFLAAWQAVPSLGLVPPTLLPGPLEIPGAFRREIVGGYWLAAVWASLGHYVTGLVLGSLLGIALGVATGLWRPLEEATAWLVRLLRPIPGLAWVPFAIVWLGVTPAAATFIVAVGVFWINFFAALGAVQSVDRDLIEVAAAFGHRSARGRLTKVILPAAAPGILAGLRTGLGQAWMAVIAAELFGVPGLGQRMMQASSLLATDLVVVYMITMAALYGAVDSAFLLLRNRVLAWQR